MDKQNIKSDYNVVCFLTKDGQFTPLSSLVVASFSLHSSLENARKEADKRTASTIKALEMCHSVPWKCVVTIIHSGIYVKYLHRRYLINYENNELPF